VLIAVASDNRNRVGCVRHFFTRSFTSYSEQIECCCGIASPLSLSLSLSLSVCKVHGEFTASYAGSYVEANEFLSFEKRRRGRRLWRIYVLPPPQFASSLLPNFITSAILLREIARMPRSLRSLRSVREYRRGTRHSEIMPRYSLADLWRADVIYRR